MKCIFRPRALLIYLVVCTCSLISTSPAQALPYYDGIDRTPFYGQLFVGASSADLKLSGTSSYQDSGAGAHGGFQGGLRMFRRWAIAGYFDYISPIVSGQGSSYLARFEQTLMYDLNRSENTTVKFGLGWNLNFLQSGPREYGYQGLAGVHAYLGYRVFGLNIFGRYGPVANSGTMSTSNSSLCYGIQLPLGGPNFAPHFSVYAETMSINFTSKVTLNSSTFNLTLVGLSVGI